ncbi:RagB/SusD family nutrient uptake outer membrane protein [Limibacter armeniacum]|uniref:RagB/SusD family nutrient uptake outer membrane protein n=1 Tax=Limibacter armeniacum TaxID=466084 RepID=UPI002FE620AE
MKKILILMALGLFTITSCDDFLEEQNKSNVTAEEFYVTEEGFNALVNANYASLREIYGQDPWLFVAGTDLYREGRDQAPTGLSQYTQLNPSSEGVDFLYSNCFKTIQQANTALHYAELTEQNNMIPQYVGEVKYIRATAYFLLVQTYGGVSKIDAILEEAITEYERESAENIYAFIIQDLEQALAAVKDGAFDGRVNKKAVQHMLAKVHLTRAYESFAAGDDFAKAASYADAVIGGQPLSLSFEELWTPGNEMNSEVVFSVQFSSGSIGTADNRLGNQQQGFFGPYLGGSDVAGDAPWKSYNLCPTRFALDLYEQGDERWEGTFMTEVYDRYYDYFDVDDHSELTVAHFYAPSWFTAEDEAAYMAEHPEASYHAYGTHDPDGAEILSDYTTIIVKKFDDPESRFGGRGDNGRVSARDFVVSRLAETYLIAAEAYLGVGNAAVGLDRLNEVRNRAGVAPAAAAAFDIDYILDERGRELLGEYHRWFDLKRTGKLLERASAYNSLIEPSNFDGSNGEKKILRPIPQQAIDLNQNKGFQQNPAYQ